MDGQLATFDAETAVLDRETNGTPDLAANQVDAAAKVPSVARAMAQYIDIAATELGIPDGAKLAQFVAIFDDGRCVIAREKGNDPEIRRLISLLADKLNLTLERRYASITEIADLRKEGIAGRRGQSDARMQNDILDFIDKAWAKNASDIHFHVGHKVATVQIRVDGRLLEAAEWTAEYAVQFLGAAYAMADIANKSFSPAVYLSARLAPREKDDWTLPIGLELLRMQFNPVAFGQCCSVWRLLNATNDELDLEKLGYLPAQIETLQEFTRKEKGMALFAGPTGSGKSTSMCAMLDYAREIDARANDIKSVFTIEDPPERRIRGAQQLVVPNTTTDEEREKAFADASKAAMRSDPQRMMFGEIRDRTTAGFAVGASLTGHSVCGTVHAASAHAVARRLIDLGVDPSLIYGSDELFLVSAQVLAPLLCKHCCIPAAEALKIGRISDREAQNLGQAFGPDFLVRGVGCTHCNGSGVKGRILVAEVIRTDDDYLRVLEHEGIVAARNFCRERGEPSISDVGAIRVQAHEICALYAESVVNMAELKRLRAAGGAV
jgi:general secretion pathway protein E